MKISVRDGREIQIRIYRNPAVSDAKLKEGQKSPLMIIFHDEGWIMGSHDIEEGVARWTCKETGAVCKSNVELLKIDPNWIILCGSSAGGNLTAAVAQIARDHNDGGIIGQVLNIPAICHPNHFPKGDKYEYYSWEQNKEAPILTKTAMMKCWNSYYPDAGTDIYASPMLAKSFADLPDTFIQISGLDPLRDKGFAYADRLKEDGVHVDVKLYPSLPHGFFMIPTLPATVEYYKAPAAWVKKILATKGWQP